MSQREYTLFKREVLDNKKDFKEPLTLEVPQKSAHDVLDILKELRGYFLSLQKGKIPTEIESEKHYTLSGTQRDFVLKISPISKMTREGRIVNYHYIVIRQFVREGKPFIRIDTYLNTQYEREGIQMDSVLSVLARHLEAQESFVVKKEKLIRFEPRKQ